MKKCGYCDSMIPDIGEKYCSMLCRAVAGANEAIEAKENRDYELIRTALKAMADETRFTALAELALDALDRVQGGE